LAKRQEIRLKPTIGHGRTRAAIAALASVAALCGPAIANASAQSFSTTEHVPTTTPTLGQTWIVTGTATKGKTKLDGKVRYLMIVLGQTQHTDPWKTFSGGHYKEVLQFPKTGVAALAVGLKMTFSLQIKTKYGVKTLNTSIVEQKPA
jgi:hypothetical protein